MRALPRPSHDDFKTIKAAVRKYGWKKCHQEKWEEAYKHYEANCGDPFKTLKTRFDPDISAQLEGLYDTRRSGGHIERIRKAHADRCCPVCGAEHPGSVDHYLPKSSFQEFSILSLNLIPACDICNPVKGKKTGGVSPNQYLLHPYFDKIAEQELWEVYFTGRPEYVSFSPKSNANLAPSLRTRVDYHLSIVTGDRFQSFMNGRWADFSAIVEETALDEKLTSVTSKFASQVASQLLKFARVRDQHNSWRSAFYRGLLARADLIQWFVDQLNLKFEVSTVGQPSTVVPERSSLPSSVIRQADL